MRYIQGESREQLIFLPASLDDYISSDNETRNIDLFVNSLNLEEFGFKMKKVDDGRPAYHPSVLLKLFIYGYLNRIRSSRALEKECGRNIELMWLMQRLVPDHNTISNFRKDHSESIRKVFKATVEIAKHFNLIGGKLIAGDSTKLRAQNSKKNNFNRNKIERHLNYIDQKLQHYSDELAEADGDEKRDEIKSAIKRQKQRKKRYHAIREALEQSGEDQISVSDPDSKQMIVRNNITEVAYNIQSVTDAEHNIPIDYLVTNNNDSKALGSMMQRTVETLGNNKFVALLDKGYHTGSELSAAQSMGITTIVAIPDISSASMAPDPAYNVSEFIYNKRKHSYTCPEGNELKTNGNWYNKDRRNSRVQAQHFKTPACKTCPVLNQCTKNTRGRGRVIERTEHQDAIDKNRINVEQKEYLYKRRQSIIEHNYGTIKRQWNFHFILTKKYKHRAASDVGFMFIAYNLRRILNIVGLEEFGKYLKELSRALKSHILKLLRGINSLYKHILEFHPDKLFCNMNFQGSGYLNKLGVEGGF
jgi:transposase